MPPVLLLALATLFWAGNYVVGERVVDSVGPLSLTWLRWVLSAVPLIVLAHVVERPEWRSVLGRWRTLLGLGVVGVAAYPILLYLALQHTNAVNASVINAITPAAIVVGAVLLQQARSGQRTWVGVAVGLVGVLIVLTAGDLLRLLALRFNIGDVIMLGAVVGWTAYTLAGRRVRLPPLASTAVQVTLVAVLLAPFALISGLELPDDAPTWWGLGYIVVFPSIGAYLCWNHAVPRVSPGTAGTSMNLVTVFVVVLSLILGEPPTWPQVVGGALVILGVVLATPQFGKSHA